MEDNHDNMWTYYNHNEFHDLKIQVSEDFESDFATVGQYDLVIFDLQTSDAGTYSCEAVSQHDKRHVLLGSTVLKVPQGR